MMSRASITSQADRSWRTSPPVRLCGLWVRVVAVVLFLLPIPAHAESGPATPQAPVRGEMIMLTTELVVVKSVDGTSTLIPLGKDTTLDPMVKVGDRIEVAITPDNQASSVKKLSADPPH
jgi:hypothetical protein